MKKKFASALTAANMALFSVATPVLAAAEITQIKPTAGYASDFGALINFVLRLVLAVAVLLVFMYLILGGIEYITSGGEKGKTEAARNKITSAVIGLIILGASYAILTLALGFLGVEGGLTGVIKNVGSIDKTP